jgi:hypothetical protein
MVNVFILTALLIFYTQLVLWALIDIKNSKPRRSIRLRRQKKNQNHLMLDSLIVKRLSQAMHINPNIKELIKHCGSHNVKDNLLFLRGSGRTTRMIEEAFDLAVCGEHVILYGSFYGGCKTLHDMFIEISNHRSINVERIRSKHEIKYRVGIGRVSFKPLKKFSWNNLVLSEPFKEPGEPGAIVLIDHHAIEQKIGHIINHWFRYLVK